MPDVLLKRAFLLAFLPLALAGCGESARPNIVLIIIDTARGDRFPFDGYARPTAPNLQVIANEGVVYTQAFSPAPWTVPAHASLFTGQYPSLHKTDCGSLRLPDEAVTLAETLHAAGYRTVGHTANPWLGSEYNFQQGFDTYGETWREVPQEGEDTGAGLTNGKVLRFLRWRADNPDARRQPFFLFINYFEPHLPYHPPEPERSRFLRPGVDPARVKRLSRLGHPDEMRYIVGLSDLTADDMAILNDLYDGEIAYADRRAGEVLSLLRDQGILDRTIVAIAGDHGENIGDHHMMDHKLSVHDTLLHVPLLLPAPDPAGPDDRRAGPDARPVPDAPGPRRCRAPRGSDRRGGAPSGDGAARPRAAAGCAHRRRIRGSPGRVPQGDAGALSREGPVALQPHPHRAAARRLQGSVGIGREARSVPHR